MITVNLKMDDDNVKTRISGKMSVSDAIMITSGFCGAMIQLLQDGGISEDEAQHIIGLAALSAIGEEE